MRHGTARTASAAFCGTVAFFGGVLDDCELADVRTGQCEEPACMAVCEEGEAARYTCPDHRLCDPTIADPGCACACECVPAPVLP